MNRLVPRLTTGQAQQRFVELEKLLDEDGLVETFVAVDLPIAAANPTGGQVATPAEIAGWREAILHRMEEIPPTRGEAARFGAELGRAIEEIISPMRADAAHDGVWAFLTLAVLPDVVLRRWGPGGENNRLPADRWIGRAAMGGGRDRSYLKTVWRRWRVLGPLMLQAPMLGEDELVQLFERTAIARNERLVRVCAQEVLAFEGQGRMEFARELMKLVSYQTGVRLLDVLPDEELEALVQRLGLRVHGTEAEDAPQEVTSTGTTAGPAWTPDAVGEVMIALNWESPEHARVIRHAADRGGTVTREEIYELCAYAPDRMLKGFSRPVLRVVQTLAERGAIPEGLPPMLQAVACTGPTREFRLDDEVTRILGHTHPRPGGVGA